VGLATSLDGKASHKECFTKQFATSGGKYGGGDVLKGTKQGGFRSGSGWETEEKLSENDQVRLCRCAKSDQLYVIGFPRST
jgi:hypothetical protein